MQKTVLLQVKLQRTQPQSKTMVNEKSSKQTTQIQGNIEMNKI